MRSRIAATSVRLPATPPPSTTRVASVLLDGARRLLDERLDERVLKGARDVRAGRRGVAARARRCSTAVLSPLNETS